jgi:hypothetical protein
VPQHSADINARTLCDLDDCDLERIVAGKEIADALIIRSSIDRAFDRANATIASANATALRSGYRHRGAIAPMNNMEWMQIHNML